ncbi:MAG: PKD domain-containing protein [Actinomycetales bacterium]
MMRIHFPNWCRARTAHLGIAILLAPLLWLAAAVPSHAVDVVGDDETDRYTGSGGLVLPGSVAQETRVKVASCPDCRWKMTDPCSVDGEACTSVTRGCAAGRQLLRAWISRDSGRTWEEIGLVCVPPSGPVTVGSLVREIRDDFEQALPPSSLRYQPTRGVLPYLPVIFHSGQPANLEPFEVEVAGYRVVVRPEPRWTWDFGDGTVTTSSVPGSTYPDFTVSHAYQSGGRMQVQVTTTWRATVMVDGMGPFEVSGPINQEATAVVRVGQARAVIVP